MKQKAKQLLSVILVITMIMTTAMAAAPTGNKLSAAVSDTAQYMLKTVKAPQVGTIGGEWAVLGLARSGYEVPTEYYEKYYDTVVEYVKACKGELHDKKYTEYSRLILALTAIGKDPANVGGYNLLTALGDYDKTIWQGLNGPIWALLALNCGNYDMPKNPKAKTQATRDMYVKRILDCQLPDGGWSLFGGTAAEGSGDGVSDPDVTGMALQALAKYQDKAEVKKAINKALACMSKQQNRDGGFASGGIANLESCVQMLTALCQLGIPVTHPDFVKNGNSILDNLLTFYTPGKGFLHTIGADSSNQMASEQGFYGLVAAQRQMDKKPGLYTMTDGLKLGDSDGTDTKKGEGLVGKNSLVKSQAIVAPGKTFDDISAHKNQAAIEAMAARGIIKGKSETAFKPDDTMIRAEFASIIVKALGLSPKAVTVFEDVPQGEWYAPVVGTAYTMGIVTGIDKTHFKPKDTITRQEAAVMVARAAKLCAVDTKLDALATRDILSQFSDYVKSKDWARTSLAFCYKEELLPSQDMEIRPNDKIKRGEVAQIIFNLLGTANLL